MSGTWKPIFMRGGIKEKMMAVAPFGPNVPAAVQDKVKKVQSDIEAGKLVVFKGPILDQSGAVKVPEGKVLGDDVLGSSDWFVQGVIGSPK
jgi:basic membrane lipoprotein Med (substrate-binding protein (PBP1-ABC) superfamily)